MALPIVEIILGNGNIPSVVPSSDNTALLIVTGAAPGGYVLGTVLTFFSLEDAETAGFTEAIEDSNTDLAWQHIKDFFSYAGSGAELRFAMLDESVEMDDIVDNALTHAKSILAAAAGDIKLMGCAVNVAGGYSLAQTNGFDDTVFAAIAKAQALAVAEQAQNRPINIILEGRAATGVTADLTDLRTSSGNRVSVALLADPLVSAVHAEYAAVGVALGKAAAVPVQRNIGRRKSGGLSGVFGISGDNSVATMSDVERAQVHDKGYIFAYKPSGLSEYYINDDPTCVALTDDYNSLSRGRTIDKIARLAHTVYVNELNDEIDLDSAGKMTPGQIKRIQQLIEDQIELSMVDEGELSAFSAYIDPAQNVLSTNQISIVCDSVPKGQSKNIKVTLNFVNALTV